MLLTALDLLAREPDPDDDTIRRAIEGNLCRCTGYQSIVDSIRDGAAVMRGEAPTRWSATRQPPAGPAVAGTPSRQPTERSSARL
jgi:carbon-monoxide dehydrogenase small subunit